MHYDTQVFRPPQEAYTSVTSDPWLLPWQMQFLQHV